MPTKLRKTKIQLLRTGIAAMLAALVLSGCSMAPTPTALPGDAETPETSAVPDSETDSMQKDETEEIAKQREPTQLGISFDPQISSDEVSEWIRLAVDEMVEPPTDFFGLVWPIGEPIDEEPDPQVFDGAPFTQHHHVLSDSEVEDVVGQFSNWQASLQGCTESEYREFDEGVRIVGLWIRGAADVATAPGPCKESRAVIYARTLQQDRTTATEIFFHEAYHGLSNFLLNRCAPILGRDEDSLNELRWFAEGTADYFGVFMAAKLEGRADYKSKMLERAYRDIQGDPEITLYANAYVQSAAMILMMERGLIEESKLLDGSYFGDCDWVNRFDPNAAGIPHIFENFSKIISTASGFQYSQEAIAG